MTALRGFAGNRADTPAVVEVTDDLARQFLASKYRAHPLLSQGLASWAMAGDGLGLAFNQRTPANRAAFEDLYTRVLRLSSGG